MTGIVRTQLTGLARTLAELKERVRAAVAGELGRAVSGAVEQVIQAVLAGHTDLPRSTYQPASPTRWDDDRATRWDRSHDAWDDDGEDEYDRTRHPARTPARPDASSAPEVGVAAAVAAGVYAARWWLVHKGSLLAAAGLGLGVGLLGVLGGPVVRTAVAVAAAIGDILSATDALGDGASRLDSP